MNERPRAAIQVDWNDMRAVQHVITAWANEQFPNRTDHQALSKAVLEEVPELLQHKRLFGLNGIDTELADVFILLMDLATLWKVDLPTAIQKKMNINFARTWEVDPKTGIAQHTATVEGLEALLKDESCICCGGISFKCPIHGHEDFRVTPFKESPLPGCIDVECAEYPVCRCGIAAQAHFKQPR